jgi:hypothetical protein
MAMKKLRFTWDQQGRLTALGEPPQDVLADFLVSELHADPTACERLLEALRDVREGKMADWEDTGEAWTVSLTPGQAEIVSEYAVPGRRLSLPIEELEEAIQSWMQFIAFARS